ncbi:GlxA family transcriptional regulator [Chachezhania sediminis]|uniref:GlxA family transcriptional regulator n=1 Tax=Chachezhania sediminis TaxID=2599291 RepID=UPI00131A9341|nr:helix-turn-helix domain-containing protein [Chachezhania sediminis]
MQGKTNPPDQRRHIALVLTPEPSLHSALLAVEPFRAANRVSSGTLYDTDILVAGDGPLAAGLGIEVSGTRGFDDPKAYDLVILLVSYQLDPALRRPLFSWLRRQSANGAHICGADAGALALSQAGMLDDAAATAHWSTLAALREDGRVHEVKEQLFVIGRTRSTCAGQTAMLDFGLEMLRRHHGDVLTNRVCNDLVYPSPRPDDAWQRQMSNQNSWIGNRSLETAQTLMAGNIETPLSIAQIADSCGISMRELQYLFRRHLRSTPKQIYLAIRLRHAKDLLLYSSLPIREIGLACGFGTPSAFYRAFRNIYDKSPQDYRRDFASVTTGDGRSLY